LQNLKNHYKKIDNEKSGIHFAINKTIAKLIFKGYIV